MWRPRARKCMGLVMGGGEVGPLSRSWESLGGLDSVVQADEGVCSPVSSCMYCASNTWFKNRGSSKFIVPRQENVQGSSWAIRCLGPLSRSRGSWSRLDSVALADRRESSVASHCKNTFSRAVTRVLSKIWFNSSGPPEYNARKRRVIFPGERSRAMSCCQKTFLTDSSCKMSSCDFLWSWGEAWGSEAQRGIFLQAQYPTLETTRGALSGVPALQPRCTFGGQCEVSM